jgi:hypothetical protein
MKNNSMIAISLLTTSIIVGATGVAMAEPTDSLSKGAMPAVQSALEIGFSGGYSQGVGDIAPGMGKVEDLAGAGGGAELQIGYRINPNLAIAAYGGISAYSTGDSLDEAKNDVGAFTTGLKADWHFMPASSVDPWVSLGGGVRWLGVDEHSANDHMLLGLDLARLQAGVDYRVTPTLSIGPVISATATTFIREDNSMTSGYEKINDDRDVNFNFSAGLMGRFDAFASH